MKKIINILILVALIALVIVQLKSNKSVVENRVYQYDKEKPIAVNTLELRPTDTNIDYSFTGTFEADKESKINADVQGKITRFYVDQGDKVKKGQSIVKIDDSLLQLQLQTVDVQIEGLEDDVKRYQILTDADAIQGVKLEKTLLGLKTVKVQRSTILEKINKTTVRAPFDGIVTMKMSEVGSFAAPGMPLVILTDISNLRFTTNVSENDLGLFQVGDTYKVFADSRPNEELIGEVISVGSKGNMGNSFPIVLAVVNADKSKIKSKMFGKIKMNKANEKGMFSIPASAIVGSDQEPKVYLISDGKATLHPVSIAKRVQDRAYISVGLNDGDRIVTGGFINLFDGANVSIN